MPFETMNRMQLLNCINEVSFAVDGCLRKTLCTADDRLHERHRKLPVGMGNAAVAVGADDERGMPLNVEL